MRFIVHIPELDSALYDVEKPGRREEMKFILYALKKSGRLVDGGVMADARGGFLIMEADNWLDQENFLNALFDSHQFHVESHPIISLEEVSVLLERPVKENSQEKPSSLKRKNPREKVPA
jgi:hypothetical protein